MAKTSKLDQGILLVKYSLAMIVGRVFDCFAAILLALYAFLIVGPLGFLRGPLMLEKIFWYMGVLIPMGMLSKGIRVAIDWRLGNFEVAIAQAEDLISQMEKYQANKPNSRVRRRVLMDLYTVLARAYMHNGHLDDAMQVVLRAKRCLDVDRLVGLSGVDAKTAHLVRAGLAAGRLLEGGGLATLFVKADPQPVPSHSKPSSNKLNSKNPTASDKEPKKGAKIIPFPLSNQFV